MSEVCLIYTTLPSSEVAEAMGEALVGERLAACVNILAPMTSVYRWRGEIERSSEIPMLIKTRRALAEQAIARARALHPYDVPAFIVLPAVGGWPDYLAWIASETAEP